MSGMSWEAFRLTSKSPSEVMHVLGPHGVDELIRKMLDACWRESPEEGRSFESVRKIALEVWGRNFGVWSKIKKPSPAAFFENLLPHNADQFLRQALVLCWMMLPRAGGREFGEVKQIVTEIFERNLAAWEADKATFTGKKKRATKKPPKKKVPKQKAKPRQTIKKGKR